jgi:hypothetical protein
VGALVDDGARVVVAVGALVVVGALVAVGALVGAALGTLVVVAIGSGAGVAHAASETMIRMHSPDRFCDFMFASDPLNARAIRALTYDSSLHILSQRDEWQMRMMQNLCKMLPVGLSERHQGFFLLRFQLNR